MDPLLAQLKTFPDRLSRWAVQFYAASLCYGLDAVVLAALCDIESRGGEALKPDPVTGHGADGHGWGLLQIDDRFHEFARHQEDRGDPTLNIMKGAQILRDELARFGSDYHAAIAAYNAGPKTVAAALSGLESGASTLEKIEALDRVTSIDKHGRGHVTRLIQARDRLLKGNFPLPGAIV